MALSQDRHPACSKLLDRDPAEFKEMPLINACIVKWAPREILERQVRMLGTIVVFAFFAILRVVDSISGISAMTKIALHFVFRRF